MTRRKARRRKFVSLRRQLLPPDTLASAIDDLPDPNVACLLQPSYDAGATITALLGGSPVEIHNDQLSMNCCCDGDDEELARRALRGRERWELCSTSTPPLAGKGVLSLKLDYEEILAAWSDRGSLYIDDTPQAQAQVVPDLRDPTTTVFVELGNTWRVPESSREARVMRYKEKRRSRLFAKRIRYQVRKINAEKRPRFKGRFVKKMFDDDA